MRRVRDRFSNLQVGAAVLVVLVPLVYLAFTKHVPFTHGYRFKAVFPSAVNIHPHAPVRIAGVSVGQVVSVKGYRGSQAAVVTMELHDRGLPIHRDATLKIRPRLFLEGNFFVDLHPGTPSAPLLHEGDEIPIAQTADPVQIDQVLSTLTSDTRADLQRFLAGYGTALTAVPTPAEDATQLPLVRGLTAAQALNRSYRDGGPALRASAIVARALQGTDSQDVPRLVRGLARATAALGSNEAELQSLVSNLDTTLGAFAARSGDLRRSVAELPDTLARARAGFAALRDALPPTATFARGFAGDLSQLPGTYAAAAPWFDAASELVGPSELGGLARDLRLSAPDLQALVAGQTGFLGTADAVSRCGSRVVLPAANAKLEDGPLSTGAPSYRELAYALIGLGGAGQSFDGNGTFAHVLAAAGDTVVRTGAARSGSGRAGGRAPLPPLGTRPRYPGTEARPPYAPAAPCASQPQPDFNGPQASGPPDASGGG
jgi:phospholipid/cholesterol/gamma-HCH transport system substrate-binding protein